MVNVIIMLIILVGLVALNVPIYMALFGATIYLQLFVNGLPLTTVVTGMYEAIAKDALLAVPFFIFAGSLMANTSLGRRLIDMFEVLLRPFRAGLALASVASNAFFGAISGSGPAATATFGKIIYKPLKENYNDDRLAVGLITSAGALSNIIPPSIMMIIFSLSAEISVTKLFLAGVMPGLLIVAILSSYLIFRTRKMPKAKAASKAEIAKAIKDSIPVLIMPVIVLGGIYGGICTPTEAGAVAAVYSLIVGVFILKDITPRLLGKVLKEAAVTTSQIFILVAVSTAFAQAITVAQYQTALVGLFSGMSRNMFLLFLNVLLLIIGCVFEGSSAILILTPLLLPIALGLGIDPFLFGIVVVINLTIGMFTPPFGLNIFVAQSVLNKPIGMISKSLIPFLACYIIALLLITYIPAIALCLL